MVHVKISRLIKRTSIGVGILLVVLLLLLRGFEIYTTSITYQRHFQKKAGTDIRVDVLSYEYSGSTLTYVDLGPKDGKPLLLIHGAPGDARTRSQVIKTGIASQYRILIPDRLGYGKSHKRTPEPSIEEQARSLLPLLDLTDYPVTIISHSYGGPIATVMSVLAEEKVAHNLLISSVSDPVSEPIFGISHLIKFRPFTVILPPSIHTSNVEKLAHKDELRSIERYRGKLTVPTTVFHGERDRIAPIDSLPYMEERITEAPTRIIHHPTESHFTPFQSPWMIVELIDFS